LPDAAARLARWRSGLAVALARRRVPLGFITGGAVLLLARPTWTSLAIGFAIAAAGEGIRVWAAGHLEKGREVTRSGPYRWMRHPLYVGSGILTIGVVIASRHLAVALLAAVYFGATIPAAIHTEERFLRRTFGETYDRYSRSESDPMVRRFSFDRARRNREYRAVLGLIGGFALLALKLLRPI
jgi:protein-S-isoprenylcysteine O-methyltransferase Ste14